MTLRNSWVTTFMLAGVVALSGCGSSSNSGPGRNAGGSGPDGSTETGTGGIGTGGGTEAGTGGSGATGGSGGTSAGGSSGTSTGGAFAGGSSGTDGGTEAGTAGTSAGGSAGTSAGGASAGGSGGSSAGGTGGSSTGGSAGTGGTGGIGSSCQNPDDCSNPTTMVCDPGTGTCQNDECLSSGSCPGSDVCMSQGGAAGACYPSCTPFTSNPGCSNNYQCVRYADNDSAGYCVAEGTATEGQSCTLSSINSGCAAGMLCVKEANGAVCRTLCHYFSSNPSCPSAQACALNSVCSVSGGDSANIGQSCASNAPFGESCNKAGGTWRGACVSLGGSGTALTCLKICRLGGTDCPSFQTCTGGVFADTTIGVCE